MSDKQPGQTCHDALARPLSRRNVLKGAAAAGAGAAALAATAKTPRRAAGQDVITLNWFAARDTSGYTPQQVDAFNAQSPNIQISYQEQGATTTDLHDKFVTIATAEDSSADIVSMDVPFVPEFAAAGWTIPVEDVLPAEERSDFFQGTLDGATYDGQLFAVPWYNNGPGLFYRKDLLDAAGVEPPSTYDELLAAAKQLQTPDINGFVFQASQTEGGLISWLEYLWGYGGEIIDAEGNIVLDEGSAAIDSLSRLIDFVYTEKISPEAVLTMNTGADAQNVFVEGRAVFLRMWMTATSAMDADTSAVAGLWDVAPLPSLDGAAAGPGCLGTWNLGISKFSRYPAEAAEAIRFLTTLEQQTSRYVDNGSLPARPAVFDDPTVQSTYSYVDRLRPVFDSLKPRPVTPYYSQMSANALQPNFGAAMTRQKDPDQAIADMVESLRQIIAL